MMKITFSTILDISHVLHHIWKVTKFICAFYPLQDDNTPLHLAVKGGHTTCVEHLLSTPGIDGNIEDKVNCPTES